MFKKHPKGLLAASLSNMGERFGFYVMMAILTLFLSAKFGFSGTTSSVIYSVFYFSIYALALVGGLIADKSRKYKSTIFVGIILMAVGYLLIAIPSPTPVKNKVLTLGLTCLGLFVIALGNGLFKGNLQALVGQMYDNEEYSKMRDSGFSLFYMFINVGAVFAPFIAVMIRNWWLKAHGFLYNGDLPELCHGYIDNNLTEQASQRFTTLASEVSMNGVPADMATFANDYLNVFTTGFHYAFGFAIVAMTISLIIYGLNKKYFPDPAAKKALQTDEEKNKAAQEASMTATEIKQRMYALFAVFSVVIFFWLSFHQNGASLTFFARDYIDLSSININLGFVSIQGAELFQSINPFFVVILTPLLMAVFGWLRAKGKEPSTPKKIGIGMGIAALAYLIMMIGSFNLPSFIEIKDMGGLADAERLSPLFMVGIYLILTVAELFISPLGISFVSKVAPPQYQGIMQGCWLGTTAVANLFLWIGTFMYEKISIWATWAVFVGACLFSMIIMMSMVKWLERITR